MIKPNKYMSGEKGINILGYINRRIGLGEGARSNVRAVSEVGIPYVLNDIEAKWRRDDEVLDAPSLELSSDNPYGVNLIQINADYFSDVMHYDRRYFADRYNIGFWAWELESFPTKFQKYIDLLDEIWVPSNFCLNAISQVSDKPVLRFMHSIEVVCGGETRADFNLPEDRLVYLTMFDYGSLVARKNPYATIRAFEEAFGKNTREAVLVVKTSGGEWRKKEKRALESYIADNESILAINEGMPREKLNALINAADVFVSLHRSEGFGLTMAEAMYLGKPVIATGYSANTEFMTSETGFLVPYRLIDVGDDFLHPELNERWADADVSEAARMMKVLATDAELRAKVGSKAQKHVRHILSPKTIGAKIKARLDYLYDTAIPKTMKTEKQTILDLRVANAHLKDQVEALKRIKFVRWKLQFKNLKNRLFGRNKKYIWESP